MSWTGVRGVNCRGTALGPPLAILGLAERQEPPGRNVRTEGDLMGGTDRLISVDSHYAMSRDQLKDAIPRRYQEGFDQLDDPRNIVVAASRTGAILSRP